MSEGMAYAAKVGCCSMAMWYACGHVSVLKRAPGERWQAWQEGEHSTAVPQMGGRR